MLENRAPRCTVFSSFHPAIKKNDAKFMLDVPNTKFVTSNLRLRKRKKKRLNFKYLLGKTRSNTVKSNAELELQKPQCVPLLSLTIWQICACQTTWVKTTFTGGYCLKEKSSMYHHSSSTTSFTFKRNFGTIQTVLVHRSTFESVLLIKLAQVEVRDDFAVHKR